MVAQIRSFASFCIFFLGSSLAFWPLVWFVTAMLVAGPIYLYWHMDFLINLENMVAGLSMPAEDWSLTFLIPTFILYFPFVYSHHGGQLHQDQIAVYDMLVQLITTPYGFMGWFLTVALLSTFFYFILWNVRNVLSLNSRASSVYLAALTFIIALTVLYI